MTVERLPVAVVGGGAAAVSAAMWLRSLDVSFVWLRGEGPIGGLLHRVSNPVVNYPPVSFENGPDLAQHFQSYVDSRQLPSTPAHVDAIEQNNNGFRLTAGGRTHRASAVIIATGTTYRTLGVPGEEEGLGEWVSQSAAADAERFSGQDVIVVGGGDAAFENCIRLSEVGCSVRLAARSPEFRARNEYVDRVLDDPAVEILPIPTVVQAISKAEDGCIVTALIRDRVEDLECAGVFVRIGVEPVVPTLPEEVGLDDDGYIVVDRDGASKLAGIFAAGDCTTTTLRSVATAVGDGARCARSAAEWIGAFYDR